MKMLIRLPSTVEYLVISLLNLYFSFIDRYFGKALPTIKTLFDSELARIAKLKQLYRLHVSDPGFFPEIIQRLHDMRNPVTELSDESGAIT